MSADRRVPITEARANLLELVREVEDRNVVIMKHGRDAAIMISPERYLAMVEELEELDDRLSVYESRESGPDLRVSMDKVEAELGLVR